MHDRKSEDPSSYKKVLNLILSHTNNMDPRLDYCQIRYKQDNQDVDDYTQYKNGWDVFYFGFSNQKKLAKKCYVQSVDNGAHSETRIYFTDSDSQKIVDKIMENDITAEFLSTIRLF